MKIGKELRVDFSRQQRTDNVIAVNGHAFEVVQSVKGELGSKISLLHMKVLTLIKTKSNVFL